MPSVLRRAAWTLLDLTFPPRCAGCRRFGERFCAACRAAVVPLMAPLCTRCGYPQVETRQTASGLCHLCQTAPASAVTGIRSAAFLSGPLHTAIHRLKYKNDIGLAEALGPLLWQCWQAHDLAADCIVPVPLSSERLRQRGYNQAGLLAEALAARAAAPIVPDALHRIRDTVSQVTLGWAERQANVAGAFRAAAGLVRGRRIVLVDDVCTTGATLAASAAALRDAGADEVWGVTLARAQREGNW